MGFAFLPAGLALAGPGPVDGSTAPSVETLLRAEGERLLAAVSGPIADVAPSLGEAEDAVEGARLASPTRPLRMVGIGMVQGGPEPRASAAAGKGASRASRSRPAPHHAGMDGQLGTARQSETADRPKTRSFAGESTGEGERPPEAGIPPTMTARFDPAVQAHLVRVIPGWLGHRGRWARHHEVRAFASSSRRGSWLGSLSTPPTERSPAESAPSGASPSARANRSCSSSNGRPTFGGRESASTGPTEGCPPRAPRSPRLA